MFIERTGQELRLHDRFLWVTVVGDECDCLVASVLSITLSRDAELYIHARCDEGDFTNYTAFVRQGQPALKAWERIGL